LAVNVAVGLAQVSVAELGVMLRVGRSVFWLMVIEVEVVQPLGAVSVTE
jgi:hypothetical protein